MAIKNFVEELEWRGMIHSIMPGTQEQLQKEMSTAYVGIDPTAATAVPVARRVFEETGPEGG